jgi:heme/copper-type cytochrome/quinol oxidase subunit 2
MLFIILSLIPSITLLYAQENIPETELVIKIKGHQWYWEYEQSFLQPLFDINKNFLNVKDTIFLQKNNIKFWYFKAYY